MKPTREENAAFWEGYVTATTTWVLLLLLIWAVTA